MQKLIIPLFVFLFQINLSAQDSLRLDYSTLLQIVLANHPVAKKAELLDDDSKFRKLFAKGFFDPGVSADYDQKSFDNKNYYRILQSNAKVPLSFGPEIGMNYETNDGQYLNNQDFLPNNGLLGIHVSMPIIRGLIFDERRKAIKDAEIFERQNELEQTKILNDLIYNYSIAYANWSYSYEMYEIQQQALAIATSRLEYTKLSFEQGDKPAVDTLEAYSNLMLRTTEAINAEMLLNKTKLTLSTFLWDENLQFVELSRLVYPDKINELDFDDSVDNITNQINQISNLHTDVQKFEVKNEFLALKSKLLKEQLKPQLNLKYNPINDFFDENLLQINNYKLGVEFAYKFFNRKEKAKINLISLEVQNNQLDRANKLNLISNKIQQNIANAIFLKEQLDTQLVSTQAYEGLLEAERIKFEIGENSLFVLISRENKLINMYQKYLDINFKYLQNQLDLLLISQQFDNVY